MSSPRPRPSAVPPTQEIRHVGAEPRADARQRGEIEIELPQLVQREQRHGGVRAAAAKARFATARACANRSAMSRGAAVLPVATRCSSDAAFHTRLRRSVGMSGSSHVTASGPRRIGHGDVVEQRERLKDGPQIVIAVRTRAEHAQVEVDFRERGKADRSQGSSSPSLNGLVLFGLGQRRDRSQFIERHRIGVGWYINDPRARIDLRVDFELLDARGDVDAPASPSWQRADADDAREAAGVRRSNRRATGRSRRRSTPAGRSAIRR